MWLCIGPMSRFIQISLMVFVCGCVGSVAFADPADNVPTTKVQAPPVVQTQQPQLPPSMQPLSCPELLTWLSSTALTANEKLALQRQTYATEEKISQKEQRQGMAGRRVFAQDEAIFENLISMLASNYMPSKIARQMAQYVDPEVNAAIETEIQLRKIHETPVADRGPLLEQYQAASKKLGWSRRRYALVMGTLSSIASGRGLLDSAHAPEIGESEELGENQGPKSTVAKMVYDLTNARVVARAKKVIELLDHQNMQRGLMALNETETGADANRLVYPSLAVVNTIYEHNLYAKLADSQHELSEQEYESKPLVWLGQFISDAAVNGSVSVTSMLPASVGRSVRTLIGIGNRDSVLTRYLPDIIDIIRITRVMDSKGNLVISTDNEYLDLQLQRLFENNASTPNNELLTTLARLTWHTKILAHILDRVATLAGKNVSDLQKFLPPSLQSGSKSGSSTGQRGIIGFRRGDRDLNIPNRIAIDADDLSACNSPAQSSMQLTSPAQPNTPCATAESSNGGTNASQLLWSQNLDQLLNAIQQARTLRALPFAEPRTRMVFVRFALVTLGWTTIGYQAYAHWPAINQFLLHILQSIH